MHFTLIALLVITLLALIIFFIVWTGNNDQRKIKWRLKENYDTLVERNHMNVDIMEEFRRRIIGLDRVNRMVLFIDLSREKEQIYLFDLSTIRSCHVKKNGKEAGGYRSDIYIECILKGEGKPAIPLPFYEESVDSIQDMLFLSKKAEFWAQKINIFMNV